MRLNTVLILLYVFCTGFIALPAANMPDVYKHYTMNAEPSHMKIGPDWINVRAAGAKGDGINNDLPVICKIINNIKNNKKTLTVFFPKGVYILQTDDPADEGHLTIKGKQNIILQGENGAAFVLRSFTMHGIYIRDAQNIIIRNIAIDFAPLPFTQGTAVASDLKNKTVDIKIDSGYAPANAAFLWSEKKFDRFKLLRFDGKTGRNLFYFRYAVLPRHKGKLEAMRKAVKEVGKDVYRISYGNAKGEIAEGREFKKGDRAVMTVRTQKSRAIMLVNCSNISLENIFVFSSPNSGFKLIQNNTVTIKNCNVIPLPGSGRIISTGQDGIFLRNNSKVHIEGCRIEQNQDDLINVTCTGYPIQKVDNPKTLYFMPAGTMINSFLKDHQLVFYSGKTGVKKGESLISSAEKIEQGNSVLLKISLKDGIENIRPFIGKKFTGRKELWDPKVPDFDLVYDRSTCNEDTVIRGCTFINNTGRIYITAFDCRLENNLFQNGGIAVWIGQCAYMGMLTAGENIIIQGNTFNNCFFPDYHLHPLANICIANLKYPLEKAQKMKVSPFNDVINNQDIIIANNHFDNWGSRGAVELNNCKNLIMSNNHFGSPVNGHTEVKPLVIGKDMDGTHITGNSFSRKTDTLIINAE